MSEKESNLKKEAQFEQRPSPIILLVDDDPLIAESLGFLLRKHYQVVIADSRSKAKELLAEMDERPAIALIDLGLPPYPHKPDEGFALIRELLAQPGDMKILVLSGQNEDVNIQHALTLGAVDFIAKPADPQLLLARLEHHLRLQEVEQQRAIQKDHSIIGQSASMEVIQQQIQQFADSPFPVLIQGESGTGKEMIAKAMHEQSQRRSEPFMAINCAAIAPELLEAQLFGHRKGAFTGASQEHKGFFIEAGQGTLLLDEIGELPLPLQGKLLRVIESGEFYRVGDTQQLKSRARIVAATNKVLRDEVAEGHFRADLYHRLSILNVNMPPLRERSGDSFLLLEHFLSIYADSVAPFVLDDDARMLWGSYAFPGNIRELRNIVIRLGTKYPGEQISRSVLESELETQLSANKLSEASHILSDEVIKQQLVSGDFSLDDLLGEVESRCIRIALEINNNKVSKAADALHVNRTTLYSRVQKLGKL
ncbi:MAG: sigma-54-dependent Fis family transcriptional regulator [Gammaproteobacteria bacterium]|nr:sigma-54-dependent Fis family transcriptional regulator [Gammaproteobacteria bacterium]